MSIVKLFIVGTLGSKSELKPFSRQQPSNVPAVLINFSIAVNYNSKSELGTWQEETHWYRGTAFGYEANKIATNYQIGDMIYLDCQLKERKWTDPQTSKEISSLDITATYTKMILKKQVGRTNTGGQNYPEQERPRQQRQAHDEEEVMFNFDDDVIPFPA